MCDDFKVKGNDTKKSHPERLILRREENSEQCPNRKRIRTWIPLPMEQKPTQTKAHINKVNTKIFFKG